MLRRYTIIRGLRQAETPTLGPKTRRAGPREPGELKVESAELSAKDIADALRDPSVSGAAPVMPTKLIAPRRSTATEATATPAKVAWGVAAVGASASKFDGATAVPAILDTGIDRTHAAFAKVQLVEKDFTGEGDGDKNGHGTHCAGTVFGRDVGGIRIGIARGVTKALIGKVLDKDGSGDTDMLYQGMQWAVNDHAHVISMSLGFDFPGLVQEMIAKGARPDVATSLALEAYRLNLRTFDKVMEFIAVRQDMDSGTIVVAATGNESDRSATPPYEISVSIPAAATGIVSVGAVGPGKKGYEVAYFSNTLPVVAGPGVDITSAKMGGGLEVMSGTSMATPHAAGVTALWWQATKAGGGRVTARAVASKLVAAATSKGMTPGVDPGDIGSGLLAAP